MLAPSNPGQRPARARCPEGSTGQPRPAARRPRPQAQRRRLGHLAVRAWRGLAGPRSLRCRGAVRSRSDA